MGGGKFVFLGDHEEQTLDKRDGIREKREEQNAGENGLKPVPIDSF